MKIVYVVATPHLNGACYFVQPYAPFMPPAWVPEWKLATWFTDPEMAEVIASAFDDGYVDFFEITDDDSID